MEYAPLRRIAVATALIALAPAHALASGDWYEMPAPTLEDYLQRLPAKTVGQVLNEGKPDEPDSYSGFSWQVNDIAKRAATEPSSKLISQADAVLSEARMHHGRPEEMSLIHDLRDILSSNPAKAASYIQWRENKDGEIQSGSEKILAELESKAKEAGDAMRPHWIYLRAAALFHSSHRTAAGQQFERIVRDFPNHPRAEIALLMLARCKISESRAGEYSNARDGERIANKEAHEAAKKLLLEYKGRYPQGRFLADVEGWLGAVSWDELDYVGALKHYIAQAEFPDHPEDLKSAAIMIEKTLRFIGQREVSDEAFALMADHPAAAMAFTYLLLGAPDAGGLLDGYAGEVKDPTAKLREWRSSLLPRMAKAVAAKKDASEGSWQPRFLTILAHAASNAGNQDEALKLTDALPENNTTDDLLFARAIAFQRSGKAKEAIAVFKKLLKRFPSSPLADGARIRLALAFRDDHKAGLALMQLQKLEQAASGQEKDSVGQDTPAPLSPADTDLDGIHSVYYSDLGNSEAGQVRSEIDTLMNFAPIQELAEAAHDEGLDPGFGADLCAVLAARALAHEDFSTAKRFMAPAQYGLIAAHLEGLTNAVARAGSPDARAEAALKLGDAWAVARGRLLGIPLDVTETTERQGFTPEVRVVNGRALGFENMNGELEAREELRHATHWWLEAARAVPGTPVSARARLQLLEGLAVIARTSSYSLERARVANLGDVSRQIYDRLQKECPNSPEAAEAAYWSVPGKAQSTEDQVQDRRVRLAWQSDPDFRLNEHGYRWSDFGAFSKNGLDQNGGDSRDGGHAIDAIGGLRSSEGSVEELRILLKALRSQISSSVSPAAENCLEDLILFMAEPNVAAEMARIYIHLRLDALACAYTGEGFSNLKVEGALEEGNPDQTVRARIARAVADSKMKPVRDYLDFLDAAVVANARVSTHTGEKAKGEDFDFPAPDYAKLEKMLCTFLDRYPKSRKREAAQLLLARAVFRRSWPRYYRVDHPKRWTSQRAAEAFKNLQQEPFDPKRVHAALEAYDSAYPKGRYAADIRSMRAATLWHEGRDWQRALGLTLDILDNGPDDLRSEAELRLANIFGELTAPEKRTALLKAIRATPRAVERLHAYVGCSPENPDHPLFLMGAFLSDQFGFKFPPPPPKKP